MSKINSIYFNFYYIYLKLWYYLNYRFSQNIFMLINNLTLIFYKIYTSQKYLFSYNNIKNLKVNVSF